MNRSQNFIFWRIAYCCGLLDIVTWYIAMLYCLSNAAMSGIVKIGTTENVEAMMAGLAGADPWRPPAPYEVEFAKKVLNVEAKKSAMFALLAKQAMAVPGFFRATPEEVRPFFDLLDGEEWVGAEGGEPEIPQQAEGVAKGCRDMAKCFANGQQIRHVVELSHWVGRFDSATCAILHDGTSYKSLSGFALAHYTRVFPGRRSTVNGWNECEYEANGVWLSTHKIIV